MSEIKQSYYSGWGAKLAPGDEDYWWAIGTIAHWIGCALEGVLYGTISIAQTKEKFGTVRCYCYLASIEKVEAAYKKKCKDLNSQNKKFRKWEQGKFTPKNSWVTKDYESGRYPLLLPNLEDFTKGQLLRDAKGYRNVYMDAVKLWPQYRNAILYGADYTDYLFETEGELEQSFAERKTLLREEDGMVRKDAEGNYMEIPTPYLGTEEYNLCRLVSGFDKDPGTVK